MSEKHSVIIMGYNKVKTWVINHYSMYYDSPCVRLGYKEEGIVIWEGEINKPQLEAGDTLYIDDKSIYVTVAEVIRTTTDKIVYKTNYKESTFISPTLELDRLESIEAWMEFNNFKSFKELNYYSPQSIKERELKHKQDNQKKYKWKDKYKDIKEILKMKYK